jgi:hypothetical protein
MTTATPWRRNEGVHCPNVAAPDAHPGALNGVEPSRLCESPLAISNLGFYNGRHVEQYKESEEDRHDVGMYPLHLSPFFFPSPSPSSAQEKEKNQLKRLFIKKKPVPKNFPRLSPTFIYRSCL